jgi:mannonate dehydratase
MKKNIAAAVCAGAASTISINPSTAKGTVGAPDKKNTLKLALVLPYAQKTHWKIAAQMGVTHAIATVASQLTKVTSDKYLDTLKKMRDDYGEAGITIAGVESHPVAAEKIKLGLPGRDEEIENYKVVLKAMGKVGVPMCCYNFMAGLGWLRTRTDVPERGGALTSEFNYDDAEKQGITQWGTITEAQMWDNITYFIKRVMPVAEDAGIQMALHPDDPPLSPLRGIARICTTAENFRRIMDIYPSPVNGVTFCQANFKAMGEDVYAVAKEFTEAGKNFFVHFRDIEGQGKRFRETFHDNGPTDMARMLKIYYDAGFDGPMRPDHAPTMEGESNDNPGYAMVGKVLAIGYMRGLMEGSGIRFE